MLKIKWPIFMGSILIVSCSLAQAPGGVSGGLKTWFRDFSGGTTWVNSTPNVEIPNVKTKRALAPTLLTNDVYYVKRFVSCFTYFFNKITPVLLSLNTMIPNFLPKYVVSIRILAREGKSLF
ncbi:MAG: hypothetical protein M9916_11055 [Crocinitomicaceae bacterium]|nr:hypothetical protein [Crocinitomicaceae bacterium]